MTKNELFLLSSCITALASQPNATGKIQILRSDFFDSMQKGNFNVQQKNISPSLSSLIIFTNREIKKMSKTLKKEFTPTISFSRPWRTFDSRYQNSRPRQNYDAG